MEREPVVMVLGRGRWKWVYEGVMVALALLVVALLPFPNEGWVLIVNLAVWAVFVVDYFTRLILSTDRRAFLRSNIIDLLAIMPADFFRALRVLRLLRLLRLLRAAAIVGRILRDIRGVTSTNGLGWVFLVSLCSVLAGGLVVWIVEDAMDAFGDALWWAVVTATTVGYGDLAPEDPIARVVAVILMLVGIGTIGMLTGSIATYFIGGDDGTGDPDVDHIRERLGDWGDLTAEERQRLVTMLTAVADGAPHPFQTRAVTPRYERLCGEVGAIGCHVGTSEQAGDGRCAGAVPPATRPSLSSPPAVGCGCWPVGTPVR